MEPLRIGKLARLGGVSVETVRFYERQGLINAPPRGESGYRQYPQEAVRRLRFIRRAKRLGFTLKEIRNLLGLRPDVSSAVTCDAVRKLAEEKIADVRERITALQEMEKVLVQLVDGCRNRNVQGSCPVLEVLQHEEYHEQE